VAASYATSCDVIVVESGARMGFAGPRVIEQTIGQKLPADFQTAGFLLDHGHVDAVRHRSELRPWLVALLDGTSKRACPVPEAPAERVVTTGHGGADPWQVVAAARDTGRPTTLDYLAGAFGHFVELHGDRAAMDCPSIVAGFATLEGRPVAIVGQQKGHRTKELAERNFGMPTPAGYRKALRVMRLAARIGVPIVTIVDTPGAYPGMQAEEQGQAGAIAENLVGMFQLPTPIVTVVTGEGGSGGALALAVADRVFMLEHATYSVISPEGCASILWGDASYAPQAARALRITAPELLALGVVDGVLPEPPGGAPADPAAMIGTFAAAVSRALADLAGTDARELVLARRQRFREYGTARLEAVAG
jgi:acetyl-CoA carboxylase carboxyl transferase subunit beta